MTHSIPTTLRVLKRDEVKWLLAAASDHSPDKTWLVTALATGLRRGELLAIRWTDIDLEQGTLAVRRAVNSSGKVAEPKTGRRVSVLPELLIPLLQQQRQVQDVMKQEQGAAWQEGDLVFASTSGGLRDAADLSRSLDEIAAQAGIAPVRFPALRHTACFLMLSAGIPPALVQAIVGIHRIASPLVRLSPLSLAMYREAAAKLDAAFRDVLPPALIPKASAWPNDERCVS